MDKDSLPGPGGHPLKVEGDLGPHLLGKEDRLEVHMEEPAGPGVPLDLPGNSRLGPAPGPYLYEDQATTPRLGDGPEELFSLHLEGLGGLPVAVEVGRDNALLPEPLDLLAQGLPLAYL